MGQMESELNAHLNGDAEGDKIVTSCMQVSGISIQLKNLIPNQSESLNANRIASWIRNELLRG